jgi:putative acetyltransferase
VTITYAETPEAIETARTLFREYQEDLKIDLCFQDFSQELATLPGAYAPPRGRLLLAAVGGAAAGCVALRPVNGDASEMKRLYVRPAFRSAGTGRALVETLIAEARAIGYRRICLDTLPVMARAQELYERLGFTDIPPYRENPVPGARFLALDLHAG